MSVEPKKEPPTVERSLNYIAWSLKDIVKELKELNESLKAASKSGKLSQGEMF